LPSPRPRPLSLLAGVLLLSLSPGACHRDTLPDSSPAASDAPPPSSIEVVPAGRAARASASAASPSAPPVAAASSSALALPVASASGSAPPAAPPHEVDMKNRAKPPLQSEELTARVRTLFEAIKADNPEIARDMFFPRGPFIPLKDIKNPGGYWDQLYRAYEQDIHQLHRKRARELEGAEFVSFELGTPPTWVKPGDEGNKIGYFRTFNGKLRYDSAGKQRTIELRVIISWDERWYITHLLPFKH
jgi:hypothetical protein